MERSKAEIDAAIARMDNLVALATAQEDRNAWLLLRVELRKRPKRPSEQMIAPMAAASMHIAASIDHAQRALESVGDMQMANRKEAAEADLLTPPPPRDEG